MAKDKFPSSDLFNLNQIEMKKSHCVCFAWIARGKMVKWAELWLLKSLSFWVSQPYLLVPLICLVNTLYDIHPHPRLQDWNVLQCHPYSPHWS